MKKGCIRYFLITIGILGALTILGLLWFMLVNKSNGEITAAGMDRKYLLYVPATYNPAEPTPLVISMHGFAGWPTQQMRTTSWDAVADENGFIVVFPMGTGFPLFWVTSDHPGPTHSTADEITFISELIEKLAADYNIDRNRIYASGISNGGGMSYLLACERSDQIAAVGGVAGAYLYPMESCNPSRPVPVIAFHGTKDRTVPYNGLATDRFGTAFPSIPAWAASWARRNHCDSTPEELPRQGDVRGIRYRNCQDDADVILYTVEGGGHSWPGNESMPEFIFKRTTLDINATRTMWAFFSQHALPGEE